MGRVNIRVDDVAQSRVLAASIVAGVSLQAGQESGLRPQSEGGFFSEIEMGTNWAVGSTIPSAREYRRVQIRIVIEGIA